MGSQKRRSPKWIEGCGNIDRSTAHIDDIAQDFSGQYTVFGAESLQALIGEYQKQGGQTRDKL